MARQRFRTFITAPGRGSHLLPLSLFLIWLAVAAGLARWLPIQLASWLTFIALLITPGYFLADLVGWRLKLDWVEKLALAMPLGVAVLAVPGTIALVQHLLLEQLALMWMAATAMVLLVWLLHGIWVRSVFRFFDGSRFGGRERWAADEIAMLLLLAAAFVIILPTLNLYKIDGDAYAVATFATDALAGMPMNAVEPLFGTELGPGVRMVFNQFLSLSYLWSYFADIDPITLTAATSRGMLALWALFAAYTLGKAAGQSRRFGLFVAGIQMLIYLAAPFVRGDNVSLFYFERTNADKFMVPITMLPVVFAFAIRFVRSGRTADWLLAAIATFAVSTIHPLIAAMLALAVGAFASFRLVLNWRSRPVWKRSLALGSLVALVMFLPLLQLVLARGEAPLAPSYPESFEGWPLAERRVPVLPFLEITALDLYGPLPGIGQVEASDVEEAANPFLLWRFAVNMNRSRIILFGLNNYISDPGIILEPPYLLAVLLLPLVMWRRRDDVAAQFAVGTSVAVLFVMFNPLVTPFIGALVMPWILWRFIWLLPYALIIALALRRVLQEWLPALLRPLPRPAALAAAGSRYAFLGSLLLVAFLLRGGITQNLHEQQHRAVSPYFFPTPYRILNYLSEATPAGEQVTVLADSDLSVTIPAHVARAAIIAHRAPTTSEVFPADQQMAALQRLIDQEAFFNTPYLTENAVEILHRYEVDYVIAPSGSDIDRQLQLAAPWFEGVLYDQTYTLYALGERPEVTDSVRGNTEMAGRHWSAAEEHFARALRSDRNDLLAIVGMAEIAHARGQFASAQTWLERALDAADLPTLHYRLGLLLVESGQLEEGLAELEMAQAAAPRVARFHAALGDACVAAGRLTCATEQYAAVVANEILPDESARYVAQGDLWRQQDRPDLALPYYEAAVARQPSQYNLFLLESAYRDAGRFDESEQVLQELRRRFPLSTEVLVVQAAAKAVQDEIDQAVRLYRRAIWMQNLLVEDSTATRLALAQLLLAANRPEEARAEIDRALTSQPYSAAAHRLLGDFYHHEEQFEQATLAYERAFQLDPTQIDTYVALSNQLQLQGAQPEGLADLLQETIEANPDEALLFVALGDQLQTGGDPAGAVEAYQAALDRLDVYSLSTNVRPVRGTGESRAFIYARLARAYEDMADVDTALNYYRAAVAAAPETPWTHVLLGGALRRDQALREAEAAYLRAIGSDNAYVDAYVGLAELYIDTGRFEEAGGLLQEALDSEASNTDPYMRLAELEQRRGDSAAAQEWLREAAQSAIDTRTINTPLMDALMRFGDYETVQRYLQAALTLRPSDPDLVLRLGQLQRTTGDLAAAEASLLKARRLNPADARPYSELAALYVALGRPQAALAVYEQARSVLPHEASFYVDAGQLTVSQGDIAGAIALMKTGLQQAAAPESIYITLSTIYARQGEAALAQQTLEQALRHLGESSSLLLALGRYYVENSDFAAAQEQFKRALELNSNDAAAYAGLGDMYMRRADAENALVQYQEAFNREPNNPSYILALANAYAAAESSAEAEAAYQQAISLQPTLENAHLGLAAFYAAEERPDEAEAAYERALATNPASGRVLRQYAAFLQAQGDEEGALVLLDQAVTLAPSAESLIARAGLHAAAGRADAALADLEQAHRLEPGSIIALVALGDLYRDQELYSEAEKVYLSVVQVAPGLPIGFVRLGALAGLQGDLQAAQEYADVARELAPGQLSAPGDVAQ